MSFRHVHPAAAMRSLTSRKQVEDGRAGIVVTHRALVVAHRDLDIVTVKTIQWNRSPVGGVPIAKLLQWTVVTHRALVVAERDLEEVTVKTIQ